MPQFKLSPSDFAYLYEDCKFCYVLKVKSGVALPSMPMPRVFSAINTRLQGNLIGKSLKSLSKNLPEGEVISQEGFVESVVIPGTSVYIKGKYDLLVKNPDGTHMVVDLKISQPGEDKIEKYKTQLAAYKYAFENPKNGQPIKITKLGLLIFYPDQVSFQNDTAILHFPPVWLEIPIDDEYFLTFIKAIDELLAGPEPGVSVTCRWCVYRKYFEPQALVEDIPF
ncbi:PD-(D/E)XK nuclease family protein [Candidatus Microgenomates bacterium]|nr:PD-(D/E)XK nuclease family protein [Candidatus Microgenomates bacterium]